MASPPPQADERPQAGFSGLAERVWRRVVAFAARPGRGPVRRTVALAVRCFTRHAADGGGLKAAAISYWGVLSFFPFVLLLASTATLLIGDDPAEVEAVVSSVRVVVPILREDFWQDVLAFAEARRAVSFVSVAIVFLIASRVTVATEQALATIFRLPEGAPGAKRHRAFAPRLRAYFLTFVGFMLLGAVFAARNFSALLVRLDLPAVDGVSSLVEGLAGSRALPSIVLLALAYVIFRRVPRTQVAARHALVGAALFVAGHDGALALYRRLVAVAARQDLVYGSFVGIVSLTVWVYWIATLLLLAAEVVADLNGNRTEMPGDDGSG